MYWISLRKLINPIIVLLACLVLRPYASTLQPAYMQMLQTAPYLLLGVVAALSSYYNRSRLFIAALSILVIYFLIQTQLQSTLSQQSTMLVYSLISVLHPISLLILILMSERGLLNRHGLILIALFVLTLFSGTALLNYFPVLSFYPLYLIRGYPLSLIRVSFYQFQPPFYISLFFCQYL